MADNNHFPPQTFVVTTGGKKRKPSVLDPRIRLVNPDGTPWQGDPPDVTVSWDAVTGKPTTLPPTDGSVTTAKLADNAVTKAKLGSDVIIPEAYTLPPAGTAIGGVKKGTAVPDTETSDAATAATVAASLNALLASLRAAGVIAES